MSGALLSATLTAFGGTGEIRTALAGGLLYGSGFGFVLMLCVAVGILMHG